MNIPDPIRQLLPGIREAFDEQVMREHVQTALFGARDAFVVESCKPDKPLYLPGKCCSLQYELQVRDRASGAVLEPVVVGRVFPDRTSSAAYMSERLVPLVPRARACAELTPFAEPAAVIEPLHMCVHVLPLDGELPALIDATDPARMAGVLRELLPPGFVVEDFRIEVVSYRRRQRCVLRYGVTGREANGGWRRFVAYGKLAPFGRVGLYEQMLTALRAHFEARPGDRLTVPRALGWRPELGLALLEEVPGEAAFGAALRARMGERTSPDAPPLEEMLATCARVAAALHESGLQLGPARPLDQLLAELSRDVEITRGIAPEFAERARGWLLRLANHARRSKPLPARLCHGDFKHPQLLFAGAHTGIVDFDTVCRAEPALDLGNFLAYMRTQIEKMQRRGKTGTAPHDLGERFLGEYARAVGGAVDERRLRDRTAVYEVASLLRMALHSWLKFQDLRLDGSAALLDARMSQLQ